MAEALYRKYRPQVFSEVVGQDHIERTIKNAIDQDKLSHAYLFCGPRGTGKTTTARLLAKALLCDNGPTSNPDGTCTSCQEIAQGEHPDVYELDAASRTGVENVREEIISRVQFAPTRGKYKVYIIDEVHMLSVAAFNALLKTLEEPPGHVVFILCTTDPQKVPETILSRCQRFDFRRIDNQGMTDRLAEICQAEGVEFEREALEVIAGRSGGGLRNALTALEQAIAFGEGSVSVAVVQQLGGTQAACDLTAAIDALAKRDIAAAFMWVDSFAQTGGDFARLTADLAQRVRDMYFLAMAGAKAPLSVADEMRPQIIDQAKRFAPDRLAYMLETLGDVMVQLKQATNARLCFEIALTKICHPASDVTLESLAERVEALEQRPVAAVAAGEGAAIAAAVAQAASPVERPASQVPATVRVETRPAVPTTAAPIASSQAAVAESRPAAATQVTPEARPTEANVPQVVEPRLEECKPAVQGAAPSASSATSPAVAPAAAATAASVSAPAVSSDNHASAATAEKLEGFANPAVVQRMWKRAFAEIKRERPTYTSLLMSAHVSFNQAKGSLDIVFRQSCAHALTMLQKPDALEYLRQAVSYAAGASIPVVVLAEGAATSVASASAATVTGATTATPAAASDSVEAEQSAASSEVSRESEFLSSITRTMRGTAGAARKAELVQQAPATEAAASAPEAEEKPDAMTQATPGWSPDGATPGAEEHVHAKEESYAYEEVPLDAYSGFDSYGWEDEPPFDEDEPPAQKRETAAGMAAQPAPELAAAAPSATPAASSQPVKQEVPPWEDDPFAIPEDDGPTIGLEEFQQMLTSSFGEGVVVQEA